VSAGRDQLWRFGALALFCGVPLLLLGLSFANLTQASAAREIAARQQTTMAQIVAQIAKHRAHGATPADTASLYLGSTTPSLARAELQERTTQLVAAAGGHLAEAQFTSTPEQEADGTVAIQLSLAIDNKALFELLWSIESRVPLIDVTDLSARQSDAQSDGGVGTANGALHVDLTVQGHWRKSTG